MALTSGGPLVPFGNWKNKLFFFRNYNGFAYTAVNPTQLTFQATNATGRRTSRALLTNGVVTNAQLLTPNGAGIYDPSTQTTCTANNGGKPCRYRYGYGPGGTSSSTNLGGGVIQCASNPQSCVDVIPSSQFSAVALKMQSFLPSGIGTGLSNNFTAPNPTRTQELVDSKTVSTTSSAPRHAGDARSHRA